MPMLVEPTPRVAMQTAGRPVSLPIASAMKAAPPSCRVATSEICSSPCIESSTPRNDSPGTVKACRTPSRFNCSTSARAPVIRATLCLPLKERLNRQDAKSAKGTRGLGVHESLEPVLERPRVEVDKQAKVITCGLEVGDNLRIMNRRERLDRFQFDDDGIVYEQVHLPLADEAAFVCHGDCRLARKGYPLQLELHAERFLVDRLKEPRPQGLVDLECGPDDCVGQPVEPLSR